MPGHPRPTISWKGLLILAGAAWGCGGADDQSAPASSFLLTDVRIVDGTGAAAYQGAVRVHDGSIIETGDLSPRESEAVVDGAGLVLAPGFIDTHSHHDGGLADLRDATGAVSQGITTIVAGQDGSSPHPLGEFFTRLRGTPAAVNVASYVGHGSLREAVMGEDFRRLATDEEVDSMVTLLEAAMEDGALGLSTGLEYDPGIYSDTEEVLRLARVAARHGGRYISHMRSEDRALDEAIEELIRIGREADIPVQISHLKLAMKSLWGQADRIVDRLDRARAEGVDVTADVYPYEYWQSTMTVLFPARDFTDREAAAFALRDLAPPEGILFGRFSPEPSYVGKTLSEIAQLRGTDPVTTYLDLIAEVYPPSGPAGSESIIATSMDTDDVARLLRWEHANVASDGSLAGRHPRGFGSFTRVLRWLVREEGTLSLEEAVHKMTQISARHVGITDRGVIAPGMAADLVLFDPAVVTDRATPQEPNLVSEGIRGVWVNGVRVWTGTAPTGSFPGLVLPRGP